MKAQLVFLLVLLACVMAFFFGNLAIVATGFHEGGW
jgi:hypothetical protein